MQVDGCTVDGFHHNVAQGFKIRGQTHRSHDVLLIVFDDELGPGVGIVGLDALLDVGQRHVVADQRVGVDTHLELLDLTADGKNFGNALYRLQVELDDPVLDLPQLGIAVLSAGVLQHVEQNLAESCSDGAHHRLAKAVGNSLPGHLQPFPHQLAGEVNIGAVLEVDIDHRQAEVGDRPHMIQLRQAIHGAFDGVGDVFLHLLRRQAFGFHKDLHQRR